MARYTGRFAAPSAAAAAAAFSGRGGAAMMDRIRKSSGEKKGMDTRVDAVDVINTTTTNEYIVANLVHPGNGSWNRVGRKIYCKSLRIKGWLTWETTVNSGSVDGNTLRMVVVWDKQPSGVAPVFSDIFGYKEQDGTEACSAITDQPKYDNMGRFQILRDITTVVNPATGFFNEITAGADHEMNISLGQHLAIDEYIKLGNRETCFQGESTPQTIADISTGGLYVIFRAIHNSEGQNEFALQDMVMRLRYTD